MAKKPNNLNPGSDEEQPKDETGLDKKDEKGKDVLPEKFKSTEELVKAYTELEKKLTEEGTESAQSKAEASQLRDRLVKLEGILETQEKARRAPPQITPEQIAEMEKRFKDDFSEHPLNALQNFTMPYLEDARQAREEANKLKTELDEFKGKQEKREMRELAARARGSGERAKLFDEMIPQIQEELRKNPAWEGFDNRYEAVFYHLLGKSTKNLARADDTERESYVEGSSPAPPDETLKDLKQKMIDKIVNVKGNVSHLRPY